LVKGVVAETVAAIDCSNFIRFSTCNTGNNGTIDSQQSQSRYYVERKLESAKFRVIFMMLDIEEGRWNKVEYSDMQLSQ